TGTLHARGGGRRYLYSHIDEFPEAAFYRCFPLIPEGDTDVFTSRILSILIKELDDIWECGRDWSAWAIGTMSDDDFTPVAENTEFLKMISDKIVSAICRAPSDPAPTSGETTGSIPFDQFILVY